jgi:hypothetical protein
MAAQGRRLGISIALLEPSPKDVFTGLNRIGRPEFFLDNDITFLAVMRREAVLYGMDSLRRSLALLVSGCNAINYVVVIVVVRFV